MKSRCLAFVLTMIAGVALADQAVPPSTAFTRQLGRAADAASARSILGIAGTNVSVFISPDEDTIITNSGSAAVNPAKIPISGDDGFAITNGTTIGNFGVSPLPIQRLGYAVPATYGSSSNMTEPSAIVDGSTVKLWFTAGWSSNVIRYAESTDGTTWTIFNNAVVTNYGRSCVMTNGTSYFLYAVKFPGATNIDLLSSTNGTNFSTATTVITTPSWATQVGNVWVYKESAGDWKMLYDGLQSSGDWAIGYATSTDGTNWTEYAGNPVVTNGLSGPWFTKEGSGYYLLAHGPPQQTGTLPTDEYLLTSTNMTNWSYVIDSPILARATYDEGADSDNGQIADAVPFQFSGATYLLFDAGRDGANNTTSFGLKEAVVNLSLGQFLTNSWTDPVVSLAGNIAINSALSAAIPLSFGSFGLQIGFERFSTNALRYGFNINGATKKVNTGNQGAYISFDARSSHYPLEISTRAAGDASTANSLRFGIGGDGTIYAPNAMNVSNTVAASAFRAIGDNLNPIVLPISSNFYWRVKMFTNSALRIGENDNSVESADTDSSIQGGAMSFDQRTSNYPIEFYTHPAGSLSSTMVLGLGGDGNAYLTNTAVIGAVRANGANSDPFVLPASTNFFWRMHYGDESVVRIGENIQIVQPSDVDASYQGAGIGWDMRTGQSPLSVWVRGANEGATTYHLATSWSTNGTMTTTNLILNASTAPILSGSDGALWNSNKVLYWMTSTATNLISDGR